MHTEHSNNLQNLLDALASAHNVPGATVAVLDGDRVTEAATGLVNVDTGVETTTDTLFPIGSVTKPYTATLIMQLVDEGIVDIDEPVRTYVPDLAFKDPDATRSVTVRQLLSHASGLHGDHIEDTGRGDDCLQRFIPTCADMLRVGPPDRWLSYFNAGYVILGRLVESVTGQTWDQALKQRLLEPLGLHNTVTLPEEAIMHRGAVGHVDHNNSGRLVPAATWGWPRSTGPCGGIITTAADLLTFARLHVNDGAADDGTTILSNQSAHAMCRREVDSPNRWTLDACGLGWMLFDWDGHSVIGHDGNGYGRVAFLRIVPDHGFAVALLANAYRGHELYTDLVKQVVAERLGIDVPDLPDAAEDLDLDLTPYVGTYETDYQRTDIDVHDGHLVASIEFAKAPKELLGPPLQRLNLAPVDEATFLLRIPPSDRPSVLTFADFDTTGRPHYFHWAARANPRVD